MTEGDFTPEHEHRKPPEVGEEGIDITELAKTPFQERPAFYDRKSDKWLFQEGKALTTSLYDTLLETTQDRHNDLTIDPFVGGDYGEVDRDRFKIELEINEEKNNQGEMKKRAGFYITYGANYDRSAHMSSTLSREENETFFDYDGKPSMSPIWGGHITGAWTPDVVEHTNSMLHKQYGIEFDNEGNVK